MTKNQFTTLVSVRIDNDVCDAMEKWLQNHDYYSRSLLINITMSQLFKKCTDEQIWSFLHSLNPFQPCDTNH